MAEGDAEGKQNAAPSASDGDKDEAKLLRTENEGLKASVASQRAEIDDIKATLLAARSQPPAATQPAEGGFKMPSRDELDVMTQTELVKTLGSMMDEKIQKGVAPRIQEIDQRVIEERMARGIADAAGKYKDFGSHQRQMRIILAKIARDGVSPTDLYKLASWKATEKATPTTKPTTGEKPTGGTTAPTSTENLTPQQIASKKFDDLMEKQGKK
ncbi:hypothetical protein LCGC14_0611330 [marine sediment metagenome]|uniref:Uncharacterized protein n=1 Tax=marine sediment metagenome TaxID=412755 RepID=A0A0F9TTW6_9ZZZZ